MIGLIIQQLDKLLVRWYRLRIKRVFSIFDCVSKVLHPLIINILILDPKEVLLLFLVLQSNIEIVNTRAHQPTTLFYFLNTIDESNFELFFELVVDIHNCYLIFEGIEHQVSLFEAVGHGSDSEDISLADGWFLHSL